MQELIIISLPQNAHLRWMSHHHQMFWSLFLIHRPLVQESASVACDNKQDDLFYSTGPHGNLSRLATKAKKNQGEGEIEVEWTMDVETRKGEISGSRWSTHGYVLIYARLEREHLGESGFPAEGISVSVSAVPYVLQENVDGTTIQRLQGKYMHILYIFRPTCVFVWGPL